MPISPTTWEAESGESLEPGRQRLQWAEMAPLHSSLGDGVRLHLKKKKKIFLFTCVSVVSHERHLPNLKLVKNKKVFFNYECKQLTNLGQARWLTPIILALWEVKTEGSLEVRSSRPAWSTWRHPVSTKSTKISWAWWRMPIIPATWEAEAGESLEPGRRRLWWAKITPLHSSLGNKSETLSQNKNEKKLIFHLFQKKWKK